jgi:hypothetical protein
VDKLSPSIIETPITKMINNSSTSSWVDPIQLKHFGHFDVSEQTGSLVILFVLMDFCSPTQSQAAYSAPQGSR